nr:hypothetical protein [uncultured Flavobacterium sp.]
MSTRNTKLQTGIDSLPEEKRKQIREELHKAKMAINSAAVLMHGTDLESNPLLVDNTYPSLWSQLYDLEQLFKGTRRL